MATRTSDDLVYDSESGPEYEDTPYEPPLHFKKISMPVPQAVPENKEVWLIKTPKDFPLSKLKTLPVSFTATKVDDNAVKPFKVSGSHFQVNEERFSNDTAKYHIVNGDMLNKKIDRFYTIREVVKIPEINYDVVVEPRVDVEKAENLRMRHFATGYAAKDFVEAQPIPESRLDADGKVLKRQKLSVDVDDKSLGGGETSGVKVKKEKKDKKDKKEKKEKKDKKEKKEKKEKK